MPVRLGFIFFALYASQFVSFAMLMVVVPVALRANGASLGLISFVYGAGLLWAGKALFSPWLDRLAASHGMRAYAIVACLAQLSIAATTLALCLSDPLSTPSKLIALSYALALGMVFQDNAVDALSVHLVPQSKRLVLGVIQASAGKIGYLIGAAGGLTLYAYFGWQSAALTMAVATLLGFPATIVILRKTERNKQSTEALSYAATGYAGWQAWWRRGEKRNWLGILFTLYAGMMTMTFLSGPLLVDHGWPADRIALVKDFLGALVGIWAGLTLLFIFKRWGGVSDNIAITIIALGQWFCCALFIMAQQTGSHFILITALMSMMGIFGVTQGLVYAMIFRRCRRAYAATDFATQYSTMAIGAMVVGIALTRLAAYEGYSVSFSLSAICPLASLILNAKAQSQKDTALA